MIRLTLAMAVATLAACGVDGPPRPPSETVRPGVTVSGEARIGMAGAL